MISLELIFILSFGVFCTVLTVFGLYIFRHLKWRKHLVVDALIPPFYFFIWYLFVVFILDQVPALQRYTFYMIKVGGVLFLTSVVYRLIGRVETRFIEGQYLFSQVDLTSVRAISRILRMVLLFFMLLFLLPIFHISVSGILAFGGAAGVGISFAAKDLLANFFGGFTVMLDRPFSLGEKIRSLDQHFEGVVEHIGWRSTRIRTDEKRPLYIPNASFLTSSIENISRIQMRRIEKTFFVDPGKLGGLASAIKAFQEALEHHPDVCHKEFLSVHLSHYTSFGPQVKWVCFTHKIDQAPYEKVVERLLLLVQEVFLQHGVPLKFAPLDAPLFFKE